MNQEQTGLREINAGELSGKLGRAGQVILQYEIIYPRIKARTAVEERINRHHETQAKSFERLIKNQYLPAAREQHKALAGYGGFEPVEISASFQAMCSTPRLLSVFTDTYLQLRHQGSRLARSSRTYDMQRGNLLLLPQLFVRGSLYRQALYSAVYQQIEQEAQKNPGSYFGDWPQIYRGAIRDSSFYLADDGIVIYFQENIIAGKNAGLPSFLVPYSVFPGQLQFGLQ